MNYPRVHKTFKILTKLLMLYLIFGLSISKVNAQLSDSLLLEQFNFKIQEAFNNNDHVTVITLAHEGLRLAQAQENQKAEGDFLRFLGQGHFKKNDLKDALKYLLQSLKIKETLASTAELNQLHLEIGQLYENWGVYNKANEYYSISNTNADTSNQIYLQSLEGLARTSLDLGNKKLSLYYYNTLSAKYLQLKDEENQLATLNQVIRINKEISDFQKALETSLVVLEKNEARGDTSNILVGLNNIGYLYRQLNQYEKALYYLEQTLDLDPSELKNGSTLINIGILQQDIGNYESSIARLREATDIFSKQNAYAAKARTLNLLAIVYLSIKRLNNAKILNQDAINLAQKYRYAELLETFYKTKSEIFEQAGDFELALSYYQQHIAIADSLNLLQQEKESEALQVQLIAEQTEREMNLLLIDKEIKALELDRLALESDKKNQQVQLLLQEKELQTSIISQRELEADNLKLEAGKREDELRILRGAQEVEKAKFINKELENQRVQQELALSQQTLLSTQQQNELALLQKKEEIQTMELTQLQQNKKLQDSELEREKQFRKFAYWFGLLGFVILSMILTGLFYFRKATNRLSIQNEKIELQKKAIEEEQTKSEALLLNILPSETAKELKNHGKATPKQYKKVSVLFTDFSQFTKLSSHYSPDELIEELSICFGTFDEIIDRHGLEKIKTIGDSYMCAGGIPNENDTNPVDAVSAAVEMQQFVNNRYQEKMKEGVPYWKMRVGIHTGEVIAGVVGSKKFAYDIWGDTVNTASRLESNGEDGKVNISEETFNYISSSYNCNFRGEIQAKHKGKIRMYFVESIKGAKVPS